MQRPRQAHAIAFGNGAHFAQQDRARRIPFKRNDGLRGALGYPWPAASLPEFLRFARWIVPSTPGILCFTKLAQMNAGWSDVRIEVFALSVTIAALAVPAWLLVRSRLPIVEDGEATA